MHVRLQEELISLEQNEALLKSELVGIERQMNEIKAKFSHIGEVDTLKDKIKDQKQVCIILRIWQKKFPGFTKAKRSIVFGA